MKKLLNGKLAKAMIGALGLNIVEAGLGFLTAVILSRIMGAENYGTYSYAMALTGIFTVISLLGQDKFSIREIAKLHVNNNFQVIKEQVLSANAKVILLAFIISVVAALILTFVPFAFSSDKQNTLYIGLVVFVLSVLIRLYIAFFQGIQKVITSLYPDKLIRPLSFFCLACAMYWFTNSKVSAVWVISANGLAAFLALIGLWYLWRKNTADYGKTRLKKDHLFTGWKPALPFALLSGIAVVNSNVDILMLGFFVSDAEIGIYRITVRIATLVAFALTAVNAAFGPNISSLFAKQNFVELQLNASKAALASLALALPCFLIFAFAGYWVLLLFGQEFTQGTEQLTVLAFGQLVSALAGSVGLLLMMTQHAKKAANSLLLSVVVNIGLNLLLIPLYGALGAAIATSTSMILLNIVNVYWVWKYLSINSTFVGFWIKK
jgi:O-antigen/teichoic acid export membrane protein